ncbi:hypothetical protein AK812_SmicGene8679 [Symbiodinium microadriaticum]|uniref:C3H1-type domain-containing protein n=1 Tax=Symbiodinium microadriaticum TaxID=2951 RepID=A0A1Q9EKA4_SYMMI|nr:hypothetical protein AK812_SmicGene8679 [Symbiodinium microadriaticum]
MPICRLPDRLCQLKESCMRAALLRRQLCSQQDAWQRYLPEGAKFQILRRESDERGGSSFLFEAWDPQRLRSLRAETVVIPRHLRPWERAQEDTASFAEVAAADCAKDFEAKQAMKRQEFLGEAQKKQRLKDREDALAEILLKESNIKAVRTPTKPESHCAVPQKSRRHLLHLLPMAFDSHRVESPVASRRRMREGIPVRSPGEPAERVQHVLYDSVSDPTDTESEEEMLSKAEARRQHCFLPSAGSAGHGTAAGCRPCAFYIPSVGCRNGTACNFCHYDHSPEERQLPKPSSRPAKGKRDKDKRRIAGVCGSVLQLGSGAQLMWR